MRIWHVRKGAEAKVRRGYPWLFSNELAHSPKDIEPGEPVELRDHADAPIGFGYGHPHSLIAYRSLGLGSAPEGGLTEDLVLQRLLRARDLRRGLGLDRASHRLCFAEADGLPGLVVDRYLIDPAAAGGERAPAQVLAVRPSTAGMDRALPAIFGALERLLADERSGGAAPASSAILLDQGSSLRALEELPVLPKVWQRVPEGPWDGGAPTPILAAPGLAREPLPFAVDFLGGQKTGFFLDHRLNLELASALVAAWLRGRPSVGSGAGSANPLRILDLFCYVGQWGAVLAREAARRGAAVEVLAVDASARALELAVRNVQANGTIAPCAGPPAGGSVQAGPPVRVHALRADVLESLEGVPGGQDIVVCDPPALVKRRKDLPKAVRAYSKLNREALRRVRPGGLFVTCSCSGLLSEDGFREALHRAQAQAGRAVQWVACGGQGLDHPVRAEFPEGRYLKCWMGIVME